MPPPLNPLLDDYNSTGIVTPGLRRALDLTRDHLAPGLMMGTPTLARPADAPPLVSSAPAQPTPRFTAPPVDIPTLSRPDTPPPAGNGVAAPPTAAPTISRPAPSASQQELDRLNRTGSGIDQIKNPWIKYPVKVLDAVGSAFLPSLTLGLPGTQLHHQMLVNTRAAAVGREQDQLNDAAKRDLEAAQTNEANALAEKNARPHIPTSEIEAWLAQNPDGKVADFMKLKRDMSPDKSVTPFETWRSQNPDKPAEEWLKLEEGAKYHAPNEYEDFRKAYIEKNPQATPDQVVAEFSKAKQAPRQPVPGVDVPLPSDVEAQRRRLNSARAQLPNGLTPGQMSLAEGLATKLDQQPQVKTFNEQVNKAQSVKQILDRGLGGPGDLATVYEFMKGLDPTSVVRESEYAAASKSGNIFSGALARFNGMFKPEGGMLSPEAKKSFQQVLQEKLDVSKRQVAAITDDYARRIDEITGQPGIGKRYLTSYAGLYDNSFGGGGGAAPPKAGDVRDYQGAKYKFDGKEWVRQ